MNFLQLAPGEEVSATLSLDALEDAKYLVMVTKRGTVKKTAIADFENVRQSGLIAIKLKEGDRLEWVKPTSGADDIMLVTQNGMAIRFSEKQVRGMGRVASGVRGIRLKGSDVIVGLDTVMPVLAKKGRLELLVVMKHGYGKRTDVEEYKDQNRGGQGVKAANITEKTGEVVGMRVLNNEDLGDLLVISEQAQVIRSKLVSVSVLGRATQGVRIMRFKHEGDSIASMALVSLGSEDD